MEQCVGGMDDSDKDLGTVFVREAGCGVIYALCIEDREETQYEIDLDREQAEKLYIILAKMLGRLIASPENPKPFAVPPALPPAQPPSWVSGAVTFPPNYPGSTCFPNGWVKPLWMR